MMEYKSMLHTQRAYFQTGDTKDVEFRIRQLKKLYQWITVHEQEIMDALYMDLNKSNFEAYATEIGIVKEEIRYTLKHLRKWAAPKRVPTPITQFPSKSFIYPEPYGIVLIMSPWNYPFQLTIAPLVGAICAGNCAPRRTGWPLRQRQNDAGRTAGRAFSSKHHRPHRRLLSPAIPTSHRLGEDSLRQHGHPAPAE